MPSEIQFYKELVDLDKIVDTASHIEGVPSSYVPFYIKRAQLLRKLADQIKRSNFTEATLERKFISYLLADPAKGFNEDEWKKRGKMLRAFEAHHKAPLKFNKLALIDASPAYHFKVNQYLLSDFGVELGNTDLNRISTHKVAHVGSKKIIRGIGSVLESLHPRGTNEGYYIPPAAADVTPKEYAQFIFDKNQSMIETANKAATKSDGLINGIDRRIQEQLDVSNTGLQVGVSDPQDIYKAVNPKRRLILDRVETDFNLGHRQLRASIGLPSIADTIQAGKLLKENIKGAKFGAVGSVVADPEAIADALEGDYGGAASNVIGGVFGGAAIQNTLKAAPASISTAVQKGLPILTGAMLFAEGRENSATNRIVNKAAEFTPGLQPNVETDLAKKAHDFVLNGLSSLSQLFRRGADINNQINGLSTL